MVWCVIFSLCASCTPYYGRGAVVRFKEWHWSDCEELCFWWLMSSLWSWGRWVGDDQDLGGHQDGFRVDNDYRKSKLGCGDMILKLCSDCIFAIIMLFGQRWLEVAVWKRLWKGFAVGGSLMKVVFVWQSRSVKDKIGCMVDSSSWSSEKCWIVVVIKRNGRRVEVMVLVNYLDTLGMSDKYHWYRLVCSFALIWLWRGDDGFWWKRLCELNWFWLDFRRLESVMFHWGWKW